MLLFRCFPLLTVSSDRCVSAHDPGHRRRPAGDVMQLQCVAIATRPHPVRSIRTTFEAADDRAGDARWRETAGESDATFHRSVATQRAVRRLVGRQYLLARPLPPELLVATQCPIPETVPDQLEAA